MRIYQVDAFTDRAFGGNPAAVCLLDEDRDDAWMQAVATEMNLSETAFLKRLDDGYSLRWFTPAVEVEQCGHATLAAAHILWEEGEAAADQPLRFHTRSGAVTAERTGRGIQIDFPAEAATPLATVPGDLAEALGAKPVAAGRNRFDLLAEFADERMVRALRPRFDLVDALGVRGVIATAPAGPGSGYDFVSRFFAPSVGIDEDPVTGSAHCCLGPWWGGKLGRDELVGYQASRRGGAVNVRMAGDRVVFGGPAVTVLRGTITSG